VVSRETGNSEGAAVSRETAARAASNTGVPSGSGAVGADVGQPRDSGRSSGGPGQPNPAASELLTTTSPPPV
jgi:hypothetical protein